MKLKTKNSLLVIVVLICVACTSQLRTLYGPIQSNLKGGYRDYKLSDSVYEISVFGNAHAAKYLIREYFLYRACELTLQENGRYFVIYGDRSLKQEVSVTGVIPVKGGYTMYNWSSNKYLNKGTIKIFSEKPENAVIYYDASLIKPQLEPNIKRPGEYGNGTSSDKKLKN